MPIAAGSLRHRVQIQRRVDVQDPNTGATTPSWSTQFSNVPAAVEPLSAREFIAAQAMNSEISARVVIRYVAGITAKHRILHGDRTFNIEGILTDKDSGIEYITMPVSEVIADPDLLTIDDAEMTADQQ